MNALAELRKRASTAAIPAIPAIRGGQRIAASRESRESQESQGVTAETRFSDSPPARLPNISRARLLTRADIAGRVPAAKNALKHCVHHGPVSICSNIAAVCS